MAAIPLDDPAPPTRALKGWINEAITAHLQAGDSSGYDRILAHVVSPTIYLCPLPRVITEGLCSCLYLIATDSHRCGSLITSVVGLDLGDDALAPAVVMFMESLISFDNQHLPSLFEYLVSLFVKCSETQGDALSLHLERTHQRVHTVIASLLKMVPTGSSVLMDTLVRKIPHPRYPKATQAVYMHNLLHILSYFPACRETVIHAVTLHLAKLDVETHVEEVDFDEVDETLFNLDLEDDDGDLGSSLLPGAGAGAAAGGMNMNMDNAALLTALGGDGLKLDDAAHKLDTLMLVVFGFLQTIATADPVDRDLLDTTFNALIASFFQHTLPMYQAKHVQFLLFYFAQFSLPSYPELLIRGLLEQLKNTDVARTTRQACASYVASFVSRAKYADAALVRDVLSYLMDWIKAYLSAHEGSGMHALDLEVHAVFYSICQAVLYTFCYRHESLAAMPDGRAVVNSLELQRIIDCRLNPLRVCLDAVADEFVRLVERENICTGGAALLEANQNIVVPTLSVWGQANRMDVFFPFDPYLLPLSRAYVDPLYQCWLYEEDEFDGGGSSDDDGRGDDDSAGSESLEEKGYDDRFVGSQSTPGSKPGSLANSLRRMGKSPAFGSLNSLRSNGSLPDAGSLGLRGFHS